MNQLPAFALCFGIGLAISGFNPFTSWIHENGHLDSFTLDEIPSRIVNPTHTSTRQVTPNGLAAGAWSEFIFFYTLVFVFYCVSNPNKTSWRKAWAHIGIPFGACHNIFFKAFSLTDFHREWSETLISDWTMIVSMILIVSWIVLLFTRFKTR